jgi:protoporphyrinogen oxidase
MSDVNTPSNGSSPGKGLPHVVILGAGPSGAGAAYQLVKKGRATVTVLEQRDTVGGNAGSFEIDGVYCDYGSHRLHPVVEPEIMQDLRDLLGEKLRYQTRHGRIRLQGKWIHFPLKPVDLIFGLPKAFALRVLGDTARKILPKKKVSGPENFATVLQAGLGKTICEEFYFPYARKLWGMDPTELAATAARRRVSGSSVTKILRKVAKQIPGFKPESAGKFYYPRGGYGMISQCLYEAATAGGADFKFGASFKGIDRDGNGIKAVRYELGGQEYTIPTQNVWSTIPMSFLVKGMHPEAPANVVTAASNLSSRGMILIYLVLDQDQFSFFDAYYFPEESIPVSRMSEPKNFTRATEPKGRTVLCAEVPSNPEQPEWNMSDDELGKRLCEWIERAGLPKPGRVARTLTRRLRYAYPIYTKDYEADFTTQDEWLAGVEGVLTFGRQGLFAHDNTHHTLAMAYAAVNCFSAEGNFDHALWAKYRKEFESHVVED